MQIVFQLTNDGGGNVSRVKFKVLSSAINSSISNTDDLCVLNFNGSIIFSIRPRRTVCPRSLRSFYGVGSFNKIGQDIFDIQHTERISGLGARQGTSMISG